VRQESLLLTSSFKNSQCQRLSEQFEGLVKIGEGSCAIVYRGVRRRDQQEAALKIMRMDDEELVKNAEKEYSLLQLVNHPNIIKALDFFTYSGGAVLVEEFFDGDSLEIMFGDEMEGRRSENFACFLFIQLLDAVAYLHKQGVIHRDVKAQNVLVSRNMTDLRLIDFNCSKLLAEGMALTMTGTREYMPPEVLKGSSPSEASDVWACGLCFHYMLTGGLPARRNGLHVHFNSSFEVVSMPCKEVVQKCLMPRRELRPQADEILSFARLVLV
jgi:cell division control protein CDC15